MVVTFISVSMSTGSSFPEAYYAHTDADDGFARIQTQLANLRIPRRIGSYQRLRPRGVCSPCQFWKLGLTPRAPGFLLRSV
jgi:hypothetical protein